jgi:hypothetical protein
MIVSTITELTNEGWKEVGQIAARDGKLFYNPDDPTLAKMCGDALLDQSGQEVTPDDAEAFVKALAFQYHGSYLRASEATEAADEEGEEESENE